MQKFLSSKIKPVAIPASPSNERLESILAAHSREREENLKKTKTKKSAAIKDQIELPVH